MMNILRWLLFLPIGLITIIVAQLLTGLLVLVVPWWVSIILVFFLAAAFTFASLLCVCIAPAPKVGAAILLTLFVLFEATALLSQFGGMTIAEIVVRFIVDFYLCVGIALVFWYPELAAAGERTLKLPPSGS